MHNVKQVGGNKHLNILKFLAGKLVPPAQTISRDQLDAAKGSTDNTELLKKLGIVTTDLRNRGWNISRYLVSWYPNMSCLNLSCVYL